jgi:YvrJ protein family
MAVTVLTVFIAAAAAETGHLPVSAYHVLRDFGFPAAVAAFVLLRLERQLELFRREVHALTRAMIRHGVRVPCDHPEGD